MLQSGLSRELVEMWAPDHRNGVVITGYSVEGTLARVCQNLHYIMATINSFAYF
jgi:cleavage and polyadenylation specificity factor subunit 3